MIRSKVILIKLFATIHESLQSKLAEIKVPFCVGITLIKLYYVHMYLQLNIKHGLIIREKVESLTNF